MRFLKLKISILLVSILSFALMSCENNDDASEVIELDARFISTINAATASFINVSNDAENYSWDFGNGTTSTLTNPIVTFESGTYTVTLTAFDVNGNSDTFQDTIQIDELFNGGLLINGDFENGNDPWIQGVDDNNPAPIVTMDNNTFYQVNVLNPDPNQPFLINLSQKVAITQGVTYILTFDAWSDQNRDIIAGIGLSGGDFSNNSQAVSITATQEQYQLTLEATNFGAPDARVLFDSNGQAGLVNIDNVSLFVQ